MTIDQRQTNETKGSHGSYGTQDSNLGRALLDSAELEKFPVMNVLLPCQV